MILSGETIREQLGGNILIDPFDSSRGILAIGDFIVYVADQSSRLVAIDVVFGGLTGLPDRGIDSMRVVAVDGVVVYEEFPIGGTVVVGEDSRSHFGAAPLFTFEGWRNGRSELSVSYSDPALYQC